MWRAVSKVTHVETVSQDTAVERIYQGHICGEEFPKPQPEIWRGVPNATVRDMGVQHLKLYRKVRQLAWDSLCRKLDTCFSSTPSKHNRNKYHHISLLFLQSWSTIQVNKVFLSLVLSIFSQKLNIALSRASLNVHYFFPAAKRSNRFS